uniref:Uncharacterized protein n=1 Tax=Calcidiscus leptoporus TaxID=127549 RepID=A0A7S0NWA4_9EUKA|mmetsp:Transcript_34497/g.80817  ORF Transcript_34497/g.80817 Transcript_34497/m.80817 type:complete len:672 (+) Transcript_34497:82-2097(+)
MGCSSSKQVDDPPPERRAPSVGKEPLKPEEPGTAPEAKGEAKPIDQSAQEATTARPPQSLWSTTSECADLAEATALVYEVGDAGRSARLHRLASELSTLSERPEFLVLECCQAAERKEEEAPLRSVFMGSSLVHFVECKGLTVASLQRGTLTFAALNSIREAMETAYAKAGARIKGLTGNHPLFLLHQREIVEAMKKTKLAADAKEPPVVALSVLLQLPMILASFKGFESVLYVTLGKAASVQPVLDKVLTKESGSGLDVDSSRVRLLCLGDVDGALGEAFGELSGQSDTPHKLEHLHKLGAALMEAVLREIAEAASAKDGHITAVLLSGTTPRASLSEVFLDMLRQCAGVPIFDATSMLNFFGSARGRSFWNASGAAEGAKAAAPAKKIGLVRLQYEYPPALGDTDHPSSFGFQVVPKVVDGLLFEKAQAGAFEPEILKNMSQAIHELESDPDVIGITGNCGFMMFYQCYARHVARVPVFMSALIQAATMVPCCLPEEQVLVLTANSETLLPGKEKLLVQSGIAVADADQILIKGLQDLDGFEAVANAEAVDTVKVQAGVVAFVDELVQQAKAESRPIRCILLECTELPHYSDALRRSTNLPVFDAVTVVNYFFENTAKANWNTTVYAPHNQAYWDKNYSAAGSWKPNSEWKAMFGTNTGAEGAKVGGGL